MRRGQVIERKWQIERDEKCEREQVHFEEIKRAIIGKNTKEGLCFRFVKKKTVIEPGDMVGGEGDEEIKFGPKKTRTMEKAWGRR